MSWDDDDLSEWLRENLGSGEEAREQKVRDHFDKKQWSRAGITRAAIKELEQVDGGDPKFHRRCSVCGLPTHPRYLGIRDICYRCRRPDEVKIALERKLQHYLWYLKEIERLRICAKEFIEKNPDIDRIIRGIVDI